jgi:anti-sigma factor RsiW
MTDRHNGEPSAPADSAALTCEEFEARVLGYIVEELTPAERQRFEQHRAGCARCTDHYALMESGAHLACQELVELVTDYLEGRFTPTERDRFEAHLKLCPPCVSYVEQMRLTIRLTGRLTEEQISPEAKRDLLAAFRNWKRQ